MVRKVGWRVGRRVGWRVGRRCRLGLGLSARLRLRLSEAHARGEAEADTEAGAGAKAFRLRFLACFSRDTAGVRRSKRRGVRQSRRLSVRRSRWWGVPLRRVREKALAPVGRVRAVVVDAALAVDFLVSSTKAAQHVAAAKHRLLANRPPTTSFGFCSAGFCALIGDSFSCAAAKAKQVG